MKRILLTIAAIAASVFAFNACDEVQVPAEITVPDAESLELFNSGISFSASKEGGVQTVQLSFATTVEWKVIIEDMTGEWLSVNPTSGSGGPATITITATDNTDPEPRSAKVTISCAGISKTVNIIQAGAGSASGTSVKLDRTEVEMTVGQTLQLVAEATSDDPVAPTVKWTSSNPRVASVTAENDVAADGTYIPGGLVTALSVGETIITAKAGDSEASCKVIVTDGGSVSVESLSIDPASLVLTVDEEKFLTAVIVPEGAKVSVEWKCEATGIAAVGAIDQLRAKVQGLAEGKTKVTAYAGGKSASCEVTVNKKSVVSVTSISLDKTSLDMNIGETAQLTATVLPENATDKSVTWSSSAPRVVSVSAGGLLVAQSAGQAVITAEAGGLTATCAVTVTSGGSGGTTITSASVNPSTLNLQVNEEKTVTLVMDPADAEVTIWWESTNVYIANVQMISKTQAKVTGVSVGQTTITVHAGDKTATCAVTVADDSGTSIPVESVSLNKTELTLQVGQQFQLVATVLPENATNKEVVWSSSVQSSKLYLDANGMVSGLAECEATVTVRCKANAYISASCKVTVTGGGSSGGDEEAVDLGLPSGLKWRSMNVGASKPEDYGNYYAWGETSTKASYSWDNYKYGHSQNGEFSKYDTGPYADNKKVLEAEDDAAAVNLGNGWRMATYSEWKELREKCTWEWKTSNGVNGMQVTGPNKKNIFLPAAGYYNPGITNKGSYGSYWTSTLGGVQGMADAVDFISSGWDIAVIARCHGGSIRPVKD